MIDTHCHLDQPVFATDREAVLARSRQAGVREWVVPAIRLEDFPNLVALRAPSLHIALGLHPLFTPSHPADGVARLAQWVERCRPIAMGEIGLDALASHATQPLQQALFDAQLDLARQMRLPLLLHVRKAHDAVLARLRQTAFPYGGIVHAFSGSLQQAHSYIRMGFCLGMGGVVTHAQAVRVRHVAGAVPASSLVLESDAPDLPPSGHRGERNEPCHLPLVVQALSALRQSSPAEIQSITSHNARLVLGLPEKDQN
ncbi:MAG: TatD family hydrolase [Magnetococcales bacterium]|nr:TatD family hydrolase [Magnetococcales bacterium]